MLSTLVPSHKASTVTTRPGELRGTTHNVAIVRRQQSLDLQKTIRTVVPQLEPFRVDDVITTLQPPYGSHPLVAALPDGALKAAVDNDIHSLARVFRDEFGYEQVHVRLEVVQGQLCPRWHADTVGLRCLVTYAGPGTLYLNNRHVKRRWDLLRRTSEVAAVEEQQAQQAGPGDWLFLKGHLWPGNAGLGAVHQSPEADWGRPRLLLTVDDVLPEACGCEDAACSA